MASPGQSILAPIPRLPGASMLEHQVDVLELGEGCVRAVCSCGWAGAVYGEDKTAGTMDALQHAADDGNLHLWEITLD